MGKENWLMSALDTQLFQGHPPASETTRASFLPEWQKVSARTSLGFPVIPQAQQAKISRSFIMDPPGGGDP